MSNAHTCAPGTLRCRPWATVVALLVLALFHTMASAQATDRLALEHDPYTFDPALCGNGTIVDMLGQFSTTSSTGRKIERLSDGTWVVAGLAPRWGATDPVNGLYNIALKRYRLPCVAEGWVDGGEYAFAPGGSLLIYPNADSPRFGEILDLAVFRERIYVLADRHQTTAADSPRDVHVVVFNLDGGFVGSYAAIDTNRDERGAGFAFHADAGFPGSPPPSPKLYVAGTSYDVFPVPGQTATMVRMTVAQDGSLSRDTNLGGSGASTYLYYIPENDCLASAAPCRSVLEGIAISTAIGGFLRRVYLVGSVRRNTTGNWDYLVIATDRDGVRDTSFGGVSGMNGFSRIAFDVGGNHRDAATAIVVRPGLTADDQIYVAGEVAQQPAASGNQQNRGIGIARLDHDGSMHMAFGSNGRVSIGGCRQAPCRDPFTGAGDPEEYPRAMALDTARDRLVIVGREGRRPPCELDPVTGACTTPLAPHRYRPSLAIADTATGTVVEHTAFDTSLADGDLYDVSLAPAGRLMASGKIDDGPYRRALTVRLRPDRLFGDGFQ